MHVCICQSVCLCYLLTHVEVVCFFFLIVFSCLATVFMLWSSPVLMEIAEYSQHNPHLPFLPESSTFVSPSCSHLPAFCSFLESRSPVDTLCSSMFDVCIAINPCKNAKDMSIMYTCFFFFFK